MWQARAALWLAATMLGWTMSGGCASPRGGSTLASRLRSNHPRRQSEAIAEAVRTGDTGVIPELIALLDSPDGGLRFQAAGALHRLTGQDFGVVFAHSDPQRAARIEQWHRWWAEQGRSKYGG